MSTKTASPLTIETAGVPSPLLTEYAAIPIAFTVTSMLSARKVPDQSFVLTERRIDPPYVKDYDAISDGPLDWHARFDTSQWVVFLARADGMPLGGATVALATPQLDMLEARTDLAVLWDIRVAPAGQRRGVGRALFEAAEAWALGRGCRELKVETQDINVAACRFYAAMGCQLRAAGEDAYPEWPEETQLLWYKALRQA
jgi:GNAT superfamily N-acetyltransferase